MDKRIRRNEKCVIGQPTCDFVFSSTRSCFIGYGFGESTLEMSVVRHLLKARGIEPIEAGEGLAPAQNVFCSKICSKIIAAQFCVVLLNHDVKGGVAMPNANVNMEYGLMLGFNKYVVPFLREDQDLPFNIAGLDTVRYTDRSFEAQAGAAIDQAIAVTAQDSSPLMSPDQVLEAFLLSQQVLVVPLDTEGDRNIFQLGRPLGYNLLMTFDGMRYQFFGNFTALRVETVVWRIKTLCDIVRARFASMPKRVELGLADEGTVATVQAFMSQLEIWVLVTSEDDRRAVMERLASMGLEWTVRVFALPDIGEALAAVG